MGRSKKEKSERSAELKTGEGSFEKDTSASNAGRSENLSPLRGSTIFDVRPDPERPKDFSPKASQNLSGQDPARHPKVFIKTFG